MRIALVIQRLAPAGGLEQHALRLAALLAKRGHAVTLVTARPPAAPPAQASLEVLGVRARTNHGRLAAFAADAARAVAGRFERTVAFHAIPGFDVVFCADPSRARTGPLRSLLPRYRTYAALERQAFGPASSTLVLSLSTTQLRAFERNDRTPPERLVLLPPTVDRVAAKPAPAGARSRLGLPSAGPVWLWMGLQAKTKGLDRALAALAATPSARLVVTGLDPQSRAGAAMVRRAARLGAGERIVWLGFCTSDQLRDAKSAADLLLHPARADVTGTVILEAMASGVPVIATAVCGYAEHVTRAAAGVVLPEPFHAAALKAALAAAAPAQLAAWSANARAYAARDELYVGLDRAADAIEGAAAARMA